MRFGVDPETRTWKGEEINPEIEMSAEAEQSRLAEMQEAVSTLKGVVKKLSDADSNGVHCELWNVIHALEADIIAARVAPKLLSLSLWGEEQSKGASYKLDILRRACARLGVVFDHEIAF